MYIHDIEDVIAIAETGSFSKAASERVFITQSALSQAVQKLENELGVKLFDRSSSPVRLTEEGRVLVEDGYKVVQAFKDIPRKIADMRELRKGRLSVGVTQFYSSHYFPKILYAFKRSYPHIEVNIVEEASSILEKLLESGKLDFSFFSTPIQSLSFSTEPIYNEEILFAIPREHPLNSHYTKSRSGWMRTVDLAQFKDDKFVLLGENQRLRINAIDLCHEADFEPKIAAETRSLFALNGFIRAGMGVGFVSQSVWETTLPRDRAVYYHLKGRPFRTLVAAWRSNGYVSNAAKAFIEMAKKQAQNTAGLKAVQGLLSGLS
jgi:DNA-binding transcriptional LysR family regulator